MGEKFCKLLITEVLSPPNTVNPLDHYVCPLESLNLSRNNLGFKTGAFLMSLLIKPPVRSTTHLKKIDLSYNTISHLVQNSIKKLLTETHYNAFQSAC
jgi:hypothetical protein